MADRIGRMTELVAIEGLTSTSDGIGGSTKTWATVASVWAAVSAGSGKEAFEGDRTNATATVIFTIRNRSDFDERNRIAWGGVTYNIREVKREGSRPLYVKIIAERGVPS